MKSWIFAFRVEPPPHVFSARNGGSVFFCAYSRVLSQWFMVFPGGEEKIDEPQMIFISDEWAKEHAIEGVVRRPSIKLREGKKKAIQFELAL
jgi:hypothetical protein